MRDGKTATRIVRFLGFVVIYFVFKILSISTLSASTGFSVNDTIVINDTVYIYETVYVKKVIVDTVFQHDTVLYIEKQELKDLKFEIKTPPLTTVPTQFLPNSINKKAKHSVGISANAAYPNLRFASGPATSDYRDKLELALSPMIGFGAGFEYHYHKPKLNFSTGIAYFEMQQNFRHTQIDTHIDSVLKYDYFNRQELDFDTIWFVNIDTLLASGDTLWYAYIDTNYVFVPDSILVFEPDTTQTVKPTQTINKYRYIEIPLTAHLRVYQSSNFKVYANFGIISGIIFNSAGKIVSLKDVNGSENISKNQKFSPIQFSMFTGITVAVPLTNRLNMNIEAYRKQNLNSMFSNNPVSVRTTFSGMKCAIVYRF